MLAPVSPLRSALLIETVPCNSPLQLLSELEEIEYNRAVAFPTYSESWLGGSAKADVNSDFVQRRRADLQNFFHSLFCQYPRLFDHPKVVQLLEVGCCRCEVAAYWLKFSVDMSLCCSCSGSVRSRRAVPSTASQSRITTCTPPPLPHLHCWHPPRCRRSSRS